MVTSGPLVSGFDKHSYRLVGVSAGLDGDLFLLFQRLGRLRQRYGEDAILEVRLDLVRVDTIRNAVLRLHGPRNRAKEAAEPRAGKPHDKAGNSTAAEELLVARRQNFRSLPRYPHAAFETRLLAQLGSLSFSALARHAAGCRASSVRGRLPFIEEGKHYELDYANSRRNLHRA